MKVFRGTLLLAALVALLYVGVRILEPEPEPVVEAPPDLFAFDKQDVVRVEIVRPDRRIGLQEREDGWWIEGTPFRASRSMVNRVKHQLHDLVARATVVEDPGDPALYGLGPLSIQVTLTFRDGDTLRFRVGDPNPGNISYYIQPVPGEAIYTVKKSAMDYYELPLESFRERRFCSFDSREADWIQAELPGGRRLRFQRTGERSWEMLEPVEMAAEREEVRGLLGRVAALRVEAFVEDYGPGEEEAVLPRYGLLPPRAVIRVGFAGRPPLEVHLGAPLSNDPDEKYAYVRRADERSVVQARQGLLEDFLQPPEAFRLRRFVAVDHQHVREVAIRLRPGPDDLDLEGEVLLRRPGEEWQWDDGTPVPGSTPDRVALRAATVRAEEFVDDHPSDLARYGLAEPRARVRLLLDDGTERTLRIGAEGPPRLGPEDREIQRYYAAVEGEAPVYLVDRSVLSVVKDAVREHARHAERQADLERRYEKMERSRQLAAELEEEAETPPQE